MRIFFSANSAPMLLGSQQALNDAYQQLRVFVSSSEAAYSLACETDGNPDPYVEFLNGFRILKTSGPLTLRLAQNRWLELTGAVEHLTRYIESFRFTEESGHHHPDNADYMSPGSMSLIIEADSDWAGA